MFLWLFLAVALNQYGKLLFLRMSSFEGSALGYLVGFKESPKRSQPFWGSAYETNRTCIFRQESVREVGAGPEISLGLG